MLPQTKPGITPDAGHSGFRRRFLHKRAFFSPELVPRGGTTLMEKLRELSLSNNRIRLDEMLPKPTPEKTSPGTFPAVTVEDVKKLMRAAEMEMVKSRLREIGKNWVPFSEFVRVCGENSSDPEQGNRVANMLDEAGNVIVLGNFVCLKPEEMVTNRMIWVAVARDHGNCLRCGIFRDDPGLRRNTVVELERVHTFLRKDQFRFGRL